jgi:hypothetical protein
VASSPTVSITAIGSFEPDSTRSSAATRRGSGVVRIIENTAAASVEPTTAPISPAVTGSTSRTSHTPTAVIPAVSSDPGGGEQQARERGELEVGRLGGEPTLEEDEQQGDHADVLDQLGVVEADEVQPVVTEQHPQREEQQRARDAEAS